ncbi:hypothetical protein PYW08_016234 [Mythimna loreyi]|uniref:Uncharacterized protein n=1 Tax=Mythimna loreyi TaxID=667449 RepID=A0ACC2R1N1_9NEOP|nr:hypothetical protein PYW08_016234 [Mythimna loreyi]
MFVKIIFGIAFGVLSLILIIAGMPDYYQDDNVVGWIKLHKTPATFKDAYMTCYYEGAVLASPINDPLAATLERKRNMTDGVIWIGTHSLFSENDFISIEGVQVNDMPISISYETEPNENCLIMASAGQAQTSNCTRLLPFVCYRHRRDEPVNFKCGTFDNRYKYEPRTGSCYKLHHERQEWLRAQLICSSEGGYLAVVNDEEEAMILRNMSSRRALKISKYTDWEPLFIGIRDWDRKGIWTTVQGDSLDSVYHAWGWGQPDNLGGRQYCGSLLKNGLLDDTWCHVKTLFICEKDPCKARFTHPSTGNPIEPDFP